MKTAEKRQKETVADHLEEIARFMEIAGENTFKVRAFQKGADAVRSSAVDLSEVAIGTVKVPGIGEGIRAAIGEFLKTGASSVYREYEKKIPKEVFELLTIPGLGPKKAMQVYEELGVKTVGELEYACKENRLLLLKGFGQGTQDKILKGIERLRLTKDKMRLDEALVFADAFEEHVGSGILRVGDLARYSEVVSRCEWLLVADEKKASTVTKKLGVTDTASRSVFGLTVSSRELSFQGRAVTLWTSSSKDAKLLRWLQASPVVREKFEKESKLIDQVQAWEPTWVESEWVGETVRKPTEATYRVSRHGHMRGIFHCHTTESDGTATLEEMVSEAAKLGYEYIGISDHSRSAFYARGLSVEAIREQREKIKALQKKNGIRIFHGIESDILADGSLDYDDDVLAEFDFVIGSIHSRFQMDEKAMTDRVSKALAHPRLTIWGHPSGRLLLSRDAYALSWTRIFDVAEKSGAAIEINAHPNRLDIDWRFGADLEKRRIRVAIDPDAHDLEGLGHTLLGERMAEKAMLSEHQILNLKSVDEMEKYLWERRKRA